MIIQIYNYEQFDASEISKLWVVWMHFCLASELQQYKKNWVYNQEKPMLPSNTKYWQTTIREIIHWQVNTTGCWQFMIGKYWTIIIMEKIVKYYNYLLRNRNKILIVRNQIAKILTGYHLQTKSKYCYFYKKKFLKVTEALQSVECHCWNAAD